MIFKKNDDSGYLKKRMISFDKIRKINDDKEPTFNQQYPLLKNVLRENDSMDFRKTMMIQNIIKQNRVASLSKKAINFKNNETDRLKKDNDKKSSSQKNLDNLLKNNFHPESFKRTTTYINEYQENLFPKIHYHPISSRRSFNNYKISYQTATKNLTDKNLPEPKPLNSIKREFVNSHTQINYFKKQEPLKISDFTLGPEIGKGAYAVVVSGIQKGLNKKLAIKIYEKMKNFDGQKKYSVRNEINILRKIEHPNIVKLIDVIETPKQIYLLMELIEGNSLLNHIKSKTNKRLDEDEAKIIFKQIVSSIAYCHSKNIYHRDIKLENILINSDNQVKLIDFGFSTMAAKEKLLAFYCGTPSYMSPEICQKKEYFGSASDVWSCGILLYAMLCGYFPFRDKTENELFMKINKGSFIIPDFVSGKAKNLIELILRLNQKERPSIHEINSHEWLN